MKALTIDTSNLVMGVAVTEDDRILGEVITNLKKNHSIRLMPAISDLMKEVNMQPKELDRIIVANGPGSYTGVRIGVTTAKTMAWSLNIPLVGVSSLEVLAQNGRYFNGVISPLFDARRGQVYTGLYKSNQGQVENIENDRIIQLTDWLEMLKQQKDEVLFIGNDLPLHQQLIEEQLQTKAVFASGSQHNPRPSELALIGISRDAIDNVHEFVPEYLRLAEAEAKWLESQQGKVD
ncbi:tRNA (adenosine(37)-N6)-threonylcarbamoyltransferase complex dimerization subunit type 1 TsaB [Desertibacillus haloalkaliphilus]|uniref:tRNA (adenosine(37)-N6)-threonylcarbamoyltransferase complex dimerization subunit type 1 TsaB n=1 Tax=Desertibacillus haloalkaliphilus TaxID=1328930 RepID=UPI001C255BC5|nr:tRNA (adenosine(37)-N6)-threonylcarbamoyltransferase complex dimerization subunit type 1 TsaB [Desertibacillus haloalkaliphilus]MBU8908567.1 tRNA (adenosine(37)-N6)-threonylcarbamoyltransferase complex dimerization subunit type 1 TsaB [Desertibacillus haloalkaliphilus]